MNRSCLTSISLAVLLVTGIAGRGLADTMTIAHKGTKTRLIHLAAAKVVQFSNTNGDDDLWIVAGGSLGTNHKNVQLDLAIDAQSGAVRLAPKNDNSAITKWRFNWRRGSPCTIQVDGGKFSGWYLAVAPTGEKRADAAGKEVPVYAAIIVPTFNPRCEFQAYEVSK